MEERIAKCKLQIAKCKFSIFNFQFSIFNFRGFWFGTLATALVLVVVGCGGKTKPVPLAGRVTLDGKPLDGATVTFVPVGGGPHAVGMTESDGVFNLTTQTPGDGAAPGDYKVLITKNLAREGGRLDPNNREEMLKAYYKMMGNKKNMGTPQRAAAFPAVYGDMEKTPLRCTIPAEGEVSFTLKSSGRS